MTHNHHQSFDQSLLYFYRTAFTTSVHQIVHMNSQRPVQSAGSSLYLFLISTTCYALCFAGQLPCRPLSTANNTTNPVVGNKQHNESVSADRYTAFAFLIDSHSTFILKEMFLLTEIDQTIKHPVFENPLTNLSKYCEAYCIISLIQLRMYIYIHTDNPQTCVLSACAYPTLCSWQLDVQLLPQCCLPQRVELCKRMNARVLTPKQLK